VLHTSGSQSTARAQTTCGRLRLQRRLRTEVYTSNMRWACFGGWRGVWQAPL
jgi:hypothetical protein